MLNDVIRDEKKSVPCLDCRKPNPKCAFTGKSHNKTKAGIGRACGRGWSGNLEGSKWSVKNGFHIWYIYLRSTYVKRWALPLLTFPFLSFDFDLSGCYAWLSALLLYLCLICSNEVMTPTEGFTGCWRRFHNIIPIESLSLYRYSCYRDYYFHYLTRDERHYLNNMI